MLMKVLIITRMLKTVKMIRNNKNNKDKENKNETNYCDDREKNIKAYSKSFKNNKTKDNILIKEMIYLRKN